MKVGRLVMIQWQGRLRPRRDVIIELHAAGVPMADIARQLGIPYQTAYMTVQPPPPERRGPVIGVGSKSDGMRALFAEGRSVAEVSRMLGVDYAFAYGVAQRTGYVATAARRRKATGAPTGRGEPLVWSASPPPEGPSEVDAILLGCVKTKDVVPRPAKDLYISPLFRGRRRYAEASGRPWWVVSAEYGLVDPEEVIAPYDTLIGRRPLVERQRLAAQVADRLADRLGNLRGKRLELHAGIEYAEAIGPELRRRGAQLLRPLEGLSFGRQLAWYALGGLGGAQPRSVPGGEPPGTRPPRLTGSLGDGRGLSRRITQLFVDGSLDLSARAGAPAPGWAGMPEVIAVNQLRSIDVSAVGIRLFLTFCAAMDRARDADRLAVAAVRLHQDHPWAFDPEAVARRSMRELAAVLREYRVSQRHSADAYGWRVIAETIAEGTAPAVSSAVYQGHADAVDLLAELVSSHPDGTPLFPLLGGPKIGPLWIRLMSHPGLATISSLEHVPVAVDVQVRKVTEYLAVTETGTLDLENARPVIQATWQADVRAHGSVGPGDLTNTPGALDPALWFYAKWGCTFCERASRQMPISEICAGCRFPVTVAREG